MSGQERRDRVPADLSVPETMKIAALLAELMPSSSQAAAPKVTSTEPEMPAEQSQQVVLAATLPELEEAPASTSLPPTAAAPQPSNEFVDIALTPELPCFPIDQSLVMATEAAQPSMVVSVITAPPPLPPAQPAVGDITTGAFLDQIAWQGQPKPVARTFSAGADRSGAEFELIPLGRLSLSDYFGMVNWLNHPDAVRHPRRQPVLDEATLALVRNIPFYEARPPRGPSPDSVGAIFSEVAWD